MEIRGAHVGEIGLTAHLDASLYGEQAYSPLTLRQFMDIAGPLMSVCVEDSQIIGYSIVLPSLTHGEGWFVALGVRADRRRGGLGRALAVRALAEASSHGLHTIRLTVTPDNVAAIGLYESLGFAQQSVVEEYCGAEGRTVFIRVFDNQTACDSTSSQSALAAART